MNRTVDLKLKPTSRRLENFSDAVFAIVVTIMVFEIRIPDSLSSTFSPEMFQGFAAILLTYALSFVVAVNLWTSHQYLLFTVTQPTRTTIWLNNLVLFFVTLIPIATRFLGMHPESSYAAAVYGLEGLAITAAYMLLRSHAARIADDEDHRTIHRRVIRLTWIFFALYAVSIPMAFVTPWAAWGCFIAVPVMVFFLPSVRASQAKGAARHPLERSCP